MDGITQGWAFRKPITGKQALVSDYRDDIFTKLEYIQASRLGNNLIGDLILEVLGQGTPSHTMFFII